ncbi:hypothetical protein CR159_05870 [Pollutimonas subterranea]|uniref:Uncharacterized protein n=1 Tax=Pollutimonas subterranea TaxID=2045210 RepID=A0A2N4U686_9BURK|nr:hypothetical protein CR159_05870 [Pollutimonas subterranea]
MRKNDEFMRAAREFDYACIKLIIKVIFGENLIFRSTWQQGGFCVWLLHKIDYVYSKTIKK